MKKMKQSLGFYVALSVSITTCIYLATRRHLYSLDFPQLKILKRSFVGTTCLDGACLPGDYIDHWRHQTLPRAMIIGAKKCGTRALLNMLSAHPGVTTARNELHHFDEDDFFHLGRNWYRSQMPFTEEGQISIEKTPAYLVTHRAPGRVRAFDPDVRLIVILRNPVDRLLSDYAQLQALRRMKNIPTLPPPGELYINNQTSEIIELVPVTIGKYAEHLKEWYKFFPKKQILVLDGERLIKGPVSILQQVEEFLELEPHFNNDNVYFNKTKGFHCWLDDGVPSCLGDAKGRNRTQISEHERNILKTYYKPFNDELFDLIEKSFDW